MHNSRLFLQSVASSPCGNFLFHELFANDHPLEVEMGCGRGKFLVACAEKFPEKNFLGIDRVARWMRVGIHRAEKRQLENLKFVKMDIREALKCEANFEKVDIFHVYFPDPWPKRRHRRRRIIGSDFLKLLHACLRPGGWIEIATDDLDYFNAIKKALSETCLRWSRFSESVNQRFRCPEFKTNYELKFEGQGKDVYYLELQK